MVVSWWYCWAYCQKRKDGRSEEREGWKLEEEREPADGRRKCNLPITVGHSQALNWPRVDQKG